MNITIINRQKQQRLPLPAIRRLTGFLLTKSGKRAKLEWDEISVVLVNDRESRVLNLAHLGHDYPTDVISFNFDPLPGETGPALSGELIINVECAYRIGHTYKGPQHELALYLAHGCDHLAGAEDDTPPRRQQMRRRELRWLKEAEQLGLIPGL
jgi:probable rRNA maturation factor